MATLVDLLSRVGNWNCKRRGVGLNCEIDNLEIEMPEMEGTSESARLVNNATPKVSYINVISNLCGFIFVSIITFVCCKDGVTLFTFHPTLMSLGWILIMTTAVNAITPGDLATEWMPIRLRSARHWVLQLLCGFVIFLGFLVILINKIIHDKPHFMTLHAKFGLASLIFMSVTMLGGIGALYSLKLKEYLAPIYTKILHASFGLTTFCLGIVTISLGLFSDWWKFGSFIQFSNLLLALVVAVLTVLRPALKIYFRLCERMENMN